MATPLSIQEQRRNARVNFGPAARTASFKNKIDIMTADPVVKMHDLEGDAAIEASRKYVGIIDQQVRSEFERHLFETEAEALGDPNFEKRHDEELPEAGSIWGTVPRPIPLPPIVQSKSSLDSLQFSVRRMQEALVRMCQVCDLNDPPVMQVRRKLRMLYLEGGLRAEDAELVRTPRIHLKKLQSSIVPDAMINVTSTVTRAATKMRARGREWAKNNKREGITQGPGSLELKKSIDQIEKNMTGLHYEQASEFALKAIKHAGTTDPDLLYYFRQSLAKLRNKPPIADANIVVELASSAEVYLLGDTIQIDYKAQFPTLPMQPAVDWWWKEDAIKEDPQISGVQNTFHIKHKSNTPITSFKPSHAHMRQSVKQDDVVVVLRDRPEPSEMLASLNVQNIVSRQHVKEGYNEHHVLFDTTSSEFAPHGRHEDKYWVVFVQRGTIPKSIAIPIVVRRGDSKLEVERRVRCGSVISVKFHRICTDEAADKRMGRKDWIGMYEANDDEDVSSVSGATIWLHKELLPPPPQNKGHIDFVVPGVPGKFEFRLHSGDAGDAVVAHSDCIEAFMRMDAVVGRAKSERDVRIFISSAFGDATGERRAIRDVIEPAVREFCSLIGQNVEITDLKRRELNPNRIDAKYLEGIMQSGLRDCMASDIFICILGDRYGYVPPKSTMSSRFSTIHPWTLSNSKKNPHVVAGSKGGSGLSLMEMEVQQKFLIPLDMFGAKSCSNCIFFFRSARLKSAEKLHHEYEMPLRTQDRAVSHLKGLIFAAKAGEIVEGYDSIESFRTKLQRMLCTRIRKMRWSGKHADSSIPLTHIAQREENRNYGEMLNDRWIEFDIERLWTYMRDCSFSGAAMDNGHNVIMAELKKLQDNDYSPEENMEGDTEENLQNKDNSQLSMVSKKHTQLVNEANAFNVFTSYVLEAESTEVHGYHEHLEHLKKSKSKKKNSQHHLRNERALMERAEEAAAEATDNTRRPVLIMGVPGAGTSSFLAKWIKTFKQNRTLVVVAHIGELATVLDTTPALFRFLAREICIQANTIYKDFFDQSDEKIIRTFGYIFLKEALPTSKWDKVVICLDGISRLRDTKRFPPGEWLLTLLRPRISLVLTGSAVTLDKDTNLHNIGLSGNDVDFMNLCVRRKWFMPRRIVFISDLDHADRRHYVSEFVKSFEDMSCPDSGKLGAGGVAFSKVAGDVIGNALLDQGTEILMSSPLTRNVRMTSGLLESISSYDTPITLRDNLITSLAASVNNIVSFYMNSLHILFQSFPFAKVALQFLVLTTQGMTERELRLALHQDEDRSVWIEFCFRIEPAFVTRSGIFMKISNRHCAQAVLSTFDSEHQRIKRTRDLLRLWNDVIMPANKDELSVLQRGAKERSSLLYRSWQAFPQLSKIHRSKFSNPTWENMQLFNKAKHESRDELWILLSSWESLVSTISQISTKHQLFHYLKVLPKKKETIDFLGMVQVNFVKKFRLPNNFFNLRNLFCGAAAKQMFSPSNSKMIGQGLVMLSKFVKELKSHFGTDILQKLLADAARVSKTDIGFPLCKDSNEMYCSSSLMCEEELSMLERGILVMLGIPSFNAAQSICLQERFYDRGGVGEDVVSDLLDALDMVARIARGELLGCARLLRSYRHRVVLPPLRLGKGIGRSQIELQLLGGLQHMVNTVMLDGPSTVVKAIVQKLRMTMNNIKTICKMMLHLPVLAKDKKNAVRHTLNVINEGLGNV
jgi:hypothetical protein